ncbi:MAG: hypothetical protein C0594_13965 [Marinilabiliales bacterium]|nr:MAG: hypothetical protein C0594_13965 [Marinilabiliales bacterium]
MKYKPIILLFIVGAMLSCTKDIDLKIPEVDRKIVIEGKIESGEYASVIITKSAPYFEPVDSSTIFEMGVFDATVVVSDGTTNDTLSFVLDFYQMPFYKYIGNSIIGEPGKSYSLEVFYDNEVYTATTTIPQIVELDSLAFKEETDLEVDSAGYLWFYFTDPDTLGNYYRIFSKTLGKDSVFVHPMASVSDDKNVNGEFIEYPVYRGWNPNLTQKQRDEEKEKLGDIPRWAFVRGETVIFKFCSIDAEHYEFWRTIEVQNTSDGNPFASPSSVYTNIQGGAIGVWGGYAVFQKIIQIE